MLGETRCIDNGICPCCGKKFDPVRLKSSAWGHSYEVECPHCGKSLEIFESIEYQISPAEEVADHA